MLYIMLKHTRIIKETCRKILNTSIISKRINHCSYIDVMRKEFEKHLSQHLHFLFIMNYFHKNSYCILLLILPFI